MTTPNRSAPPATDEPAAAGVATDPPLPPTPPERPLIEAVDEPLSPAAAKKRARSLLIVRLVALALVMVIGIFWLQTWFGTKLDDDTVGEYLTAATLTQKDDPDYNKTTRAALHALNELSRRLQEHTPGVEKFFPALAKLADHPESAVRRTAAWVMGDAPGQPLLWDPLVKLINDPDPLVQQNAACALSKYNDWEHTRPVLTAMLKPFPIPAPADGQIEQMVAKDANLREMMQICVLDTSANPDSPKISVLTPLKGRIYDVQAHAGDRVKAGQTLCLVAPNPEQVLAALYALALVGRAEDLNLIQSFTQAGNGDMIREQAQAAIERIEARAKAPAREYGKPSQP